MLIAKVVEAHGVAAGSALQLCDEQGEPLPNQTAARLEQQVGEHSILTVSFLIDGKYIVLK